MNISGKVVLVKPRKEAEIITTELSLENMQRIVGGMIQTTYPWEDNAVLVCNDNGLILNFPMNRALFRMDNPDNYGPGYEFDIFDIVCGTFFVCAQNGENLVGLTDEQAVRYKERFLKPQTFVSHNGEIFALPENAVDLSVAMSNSSN